MATKELNHTFKPGQILVDSWGYEQTNIDFYEITRVTACRVFAKRMTAKIEPNGFMSGYSTPGKILEEKKEIQMTPSRYSKNCVNFRNHSASLWDGKPESCSWYA